MPKGARLTRTRRRSAWGWLAPVLLLAACATEGRWQLPGVQPPVIFTHRVATPDVELYWNCLPPGPGVLRIEGAVHDWGGREVRFFEIEADGLGGEGRYASTASASLPDAVLEINQVSRFQLSLRDIRGRTRVDLFYQYRTGFGAFSHGFADQSHRFFVRNACGKAEHVAR